MSFSGYEQVIIIQDQLISGVASVDLGYSTQTEPLYIAGMGYVDNFISGPTEGQMNVSRYMLGSDPIKSIGDEDSVSGGVIMDSGQSVGFTRGRLLNYQISCNVGQVPEISNTFKVYGNLGGGVSVISRWNGTKEYQVGQFCSRSEKDDGFSSDQVYECIQNIPANNNPPYNTEPELDTATWKKLHDTSKTHSNRLLKQKLSQASPVSDRTYIIPTQESIEIEFAGSSSRDATNTLSQFPGYNSIVGFNYSRGMDLDSLYALREESEKGSDLMDYEALDIQIIYPIKSTFDFTVVLDNYQLSDMRAFLDYANWDKGRIEQDIYIKVYNPSELGQANIEPVATYSVQRAKLLEEAVSSQTGNETMLNISFEGYERDVDAPEPYYIGQNGVDYSTFPAIDQSSEYELNQVRTGGNL
jgi:hypothetical protein